MKYLVLVTLLLFTSALSAQASLVVPGGVEDDETLVILLDVDFGSTPQSVTIDLDIAANSGTSGLRASLVDLDELALNGSATGEDAGINPSMGTISLSLTTPTYLNVRQFAILVETFSSNGTSGFSGTVSSAGLTTGAITENARQRVPYVVGYRDILGRGGRFATFTSGPGTYTRDVEVDFGLIAQSITFWVFFSAFASGEVEVYEVQPGGTEVLLGTVDVLTSGDDEANFTSSTRAGVVTFRFKIITSVASQYLWQFVLPGSATATTPSSGGGGGGGGGDDEGGCSTGEETNLAWLGLLALLGVLGVDSRLRQQLSHSH